MQIFYIIFLCVLQHIIFLTKVIVYSKKSVTFAYTIKRKEQYGKEI
jgi:hypothetical protein